MGEVLFCAYTKEPAGKTSLRPKSRSICVDGGSAAIALKGVIFDDVVDKGGFEAIPILDCQRYACWIQEARDKKDYERADEVRDMALRFGCFIEITKHHCSVIDAYLRKWEVPTIRKDETRRIFDSLADATKQPDA